MTARGILGRCWLLTAALLLTLATRAQAGTIFLTATLIGSQETPPNASPGSGTAQFILDDVNGTLRSDVTFSGLTSPTTAAHIHEAPLGVPGPIIHPFPTVPLGVTSGSFTDLWTGLTPPQISALENGNTYINIHSTEFLNGEIRGQIVPEPASLVLLGLGLVGMAGLARRGLLLPAGSRGPKAG